MSYVSDQALARLKAVANWPEFAHPRYSARQEIGRGGMGTVFLGADAELGREVAIKVSHAARSDSALEARMREEARTLAALEHPGIVPVHDVGALADGRLFVVMKLVRGATLARHLATAHPLEERLRLFLRIAEPVAFAHARGFVHRDIKPSNVMVGDFGEVLVMDWGLADRQSAIGNRQSGTEGWMAPEQMVSGAVDPRADVFALGRLLEYMLKGLAVPKRLAAIARRASALNPAERYDGAAAMAADVKRFQAGAPVEAYPENMLDRLVRLLATYRTPVILIVAYLVMRVIIALLFGR